MMLGAPGYALVSTLQGEVRASEIVARDIKIKLGYQKYLIYCKNGLLRKVYADVIPVDVGDWCLTVREYCRRLELGKEI